MLNLLLMCLSLQFLKCVSEEKRKASGDWEELQKRKIAK